MYIIEETTIRKGKFDTREIHFGNPPFEAFLHRTARDLSTLHPGIAYAIFQMNDFGNIIAVVAVFLNGSRWHES